MLCIYGTDETKKSLYVQLHGDRRQTVVLPSRTSGKSGDNWTLLRHTPKRPGIETSEAEK